jgi:hypothetical protein
MVYAHSAPISSWQCLAAKSYRGRQWAIMQSVAYDDDATWPFNWCLREYPNKVYYGRTHP